MQPPTPFPSIRLNVTPRIHTCEPDWLWKPPPLPDYDLWLVLEGVGQVRLGGSEYPIGAGTAFVFQPGATPHGTQDRDRRLVVFAAHFDPLDDRGKPIRLDPETLPPSATMARDLALLSSVAHRSEDCYQRGDGLGRQESELCVRLILLELFDAVMHPPSPVDSRVNEVISAIRRDPGPPRFVEDLAKQTHLSPSQFTRRFRALTETSPARFLIKARLERARQLLAETDMSVSQIADSLGYRDVYFFSRQYKQFFGRPPSDFRQQQRRA